MTPAHQKSLDSLQSMVNGILIETGRALYGADKETGRTQTSSNTRLRSVLSGATEAFQCALDDLEADILRAKAVLSRDLEELRAKRVIAESSPVLDIPEQNAQEEIPMEVDPLSDVLQTDLVENQTTTEPDEASPEGQITSQDPLVDSAPTIAQPENQIQMPSPPSSFDPEPSTALGIDTTITATEGTPAADTVEVPNSAGDSVFGMTDSNNDENINDTSDLDFAMDFLKDSSTNDNSQTQNTDFDLSTFGNAQDFALPDFETSGPSNTNNTAAAPIDDLFGMGDADGEGDLMDLDSAMLPSAENSFDDMFYDVNLTGGGNDMDSSTLDESFFEFKP